MREFKRITIDPNVKNGLPCIRDTGILVSDIVSQAVYSKPVEEILNEYPSLTADDIQQAFAFAVGDIIETIAMWRTEGLTPLITIEGYSKMLAGKEGVVPLTDEHKQQFIETIFRGSRHGIVAWNNFARWIYKTYRLEPHYWRPLSITSVTESILDELPNYEPDAEVKIVVGENLPSIKTDDYLASSIVILLSDKTWLFLKYRSILTIEVRSSNHINFQILREFQYETSVSSQEVQALTTHRGSPLALAALIIREYGGELQSRLSDNGIIFEFDLPVWIEDTQSTM